MKTPANLLTRKAWQAFKAGEFEEAHYLYTELAERLGQHLYAVNLEICKRKIDSSGGRQHNQAYRLELEKEITLKANSTIRIGTLSLDTSSKSLQISLKQLSGPALIKSKKHAVILLEFTNGSGDKISEVPSLGVSQVLEKHFKYVGHTHQITTTLPGILVNVVPPVQATSVTLFVAGMPSMGVSTAEILIKANSRTDSRTDNQSAKSQSISIPTLKTYDPLNKRKTKDLIIPCILDEFTHECLRHTTGIVPLSVAAWEEELAGINPDFLLIESCWKGNRGEWGTLSKGSGGGKKLRPLLKYCKKRGIPTVFWNKEDPPHYEKFAPVAASFDLVVTSDSNMMPRYKKDFGIEVVPLPFAAEPWIHNPIAKGNRLNKAVFAGSYYRDKPKRCDDFSAVIKCIENAGVGYHIYDRNHNSNIPKFTFPDHFKAHIVGSLHPHEMHKAHKGYKYQLNMNTVQDSPTMFARRVFESLASGTPVVSNESSGMRRLFDDTVIIASDAYAQDRIRELQSSDSVYIDLARRGVRQVMNGHTYSHRLKAVCNHLGIDVEVDTPNGVLSVIASSPSDIALAKSIFSKQTAPRKSLFIELENFEGSHKYLNQADQSIKYAMRIARSFYKKQEDFYGSRSVLSHDIRASLETTALEDFIYWNSQDAGASDLENNA